MKLRTLELKNFRCFAQLMVEFHPQLTVLVANNGQGKTAVLDALRIGLWSFVSGFDLAKPNASVATANGINIEDVRVLRNNHLMARQLPTEITLQRKVGNGLHRHRSILPPCISWKRYRDSEQEGSHTKEDSGARQLKKSAIFQSVSTTAKKR